jgi:hypothetical protein
MRGVQLRASQGLKNHGRATWKDLFMARAGVLQGRANCLIRSSQVFSWEPYSQERQSQGYFNEKVRVTGRRPKKARNEGTSEMNLRFTIIAIGYLITRCGDRGLLLCAIRGFVSTTMTLT